MRFLRSALPLIALALLSLDASAQCSNGSCGAGGSRTSYRYLSAPGASGCASGQCGSSAVQYSYPVPAVSEGPTSFVSHVDGKTYTRCQDGFYREAAACGTGCTGTATCPQGGNCNNVCGMCQASDLASIRKDIAALTAKMDALAAQVAAAKK